MTVLAGQGSPRGAHAAVDPDKATTARQLRVEDRRLLRGGGRYIADIVADRMLHAAFVRSTEAHALLTRIDSSDASAMAGVHAVFSASDLQAIDLLDANGVPGLQKTPQPVLARTRVRFVGEPLAIVVAEDRYVAEDAAEAVVVEYERLPASLDAASPAEDPASWLFEEVAGNTIYDEVSTFGDPAQMFQQAHTIVEASYRFDRCSAMPLEARGCVAACEAGVGELRFWSSTQAPHLLRSRLAACLEIPEHRVTVHVPDVGGAFGQKIPISPEEVTVALAAVRLGRAVKWIEDRQENLVSAPQARDQIVSLRMALDPNGIFTAICAEITGDCGAYSFNSASALIEPHLTARMLPGPYRIRHLQTRVVARLTSKPPVAPYRGVGFCAAEAARELLVDEAARTLGVDRIELRLRNLIQSREMPYTTCNGMEYDSGDYPEALELVAASAKEERARLARDAPPGDSKRIGVGFAPYVEPTGWGTEGLRQVGWDSFASHDSARVSFDPSGHVTVLVGTSSQGQGSETTLAQVAAAILGVPVDDVAVRTGDTSAMPVSLGGTRASRTAVVTGGALGLAATRVRDELLKVAATLLEVDPADLEVREGRVFARGVPAVSLLVRDVVTAGFRDVKARVDGAAPTFAAQVFYDPGATYASGVVAAVVEVDLETGIVTSKKIFAVEDCGNVINPMIVEGQLIGGIVQGLGYALLERVIHDDAGQVNTGTLMDYLVPLASDVPPIEVRHLCSPSPLTWGGFKGVGEAGMIGGPAAIAAAVADAIKPGRVDRLPMTPERILEAIDYEVAIPNSGLEIANEATVL